MTLFKHFLKDENGATAIEYGLIAALLSITVIGSISLIAPEMNTTFSSISSDLAKANG